MDLVSTIRQPVLGDVITDPSRPGQAVGLAQVMSLYALRAAVYSGGDRWTSQDDFEAAHAELSSHHNLKRL